VGFDCTDSVCGLEHIFYIRARRGLRKGLK
jgi:hypothetical protein